LAAEGFEIVVPETLTFEEQVRIVSETRTLVTPLGAAGIISVHLPRGAAIIETTTPDIVGTFGPQGLSAVLDLRYHRVLCRAVDHDAASIAAMRGDPMFDPARDRNYRVDVDALVALARTAG
jgi:capsular polysaccharide biosynthesis protein